tara:strand:+ start:589 stop:711 length:123 start_codon:yes stop_codon:yes gene_type:complete
MKILNLYACLGGNRYKWGSDHDVTAMGMMTKQDTTQTELF